MSNDDDGDRDLERYGLDRDGRDAAPAPPTKNDILEELQRQFASPAFKEFRDKKKALSQPIAAVRSKSRNWQVGFGPVTIAPGQTVAMSSRSSCLFRGEKIIFTGDSDGVFITNMFVGNKSQFPALGRPIAAGAFLPAAMTLASGILLDTCERSMDIVFSVENRSSDPRTVCLTLFGKAVL